MEKCPKDAEDAEVGELGGSSPPYPVRCLYSCYDSLSKMVMAMFLIPQPLPHPF